MHTNFPFLLLMYARNNIFFILSKPTQASPLNILSSYALNNKSTYFSIFFILDSISIVFTTLSTLFLDEHVVETIALQEIDTIVVPFVTLAHAHIGGNHDVSFTIMHTGDVGITGNAKLLREIWGEFTNNGLFLLIIIHGTGDGIAWNEGRRGTDQKTKEREEGKKEENLITEVNLPTLIVKNNRFICLGTYLPGQLFFCRLPWRVLPERHHLLHRQPRIHSRQIQAAVASGSPLPGIRPLP